MFGSVLELGEIHAHIGDRIDHDIISANEIHVRSVWICRHLPDSLKRLSPTERKGPAIHELVLRKLEKEMKKTIETLPEGAVPQEVIHSISELPSVLT